MAAALSESSAVFHRPLCAALLCMVAAIGSAFAEERRERKEVTSPPPQPVAMEVKVERGQEATIPLRIYGQRNQVLTFLVRKAPRTGRIADLKNTGANTAAIRYRPTGDRSVHSDVFEYAVKSVEGVSAAVPVQIEIIDQPPELAGPAEVLFPPRLVTTSEVQTIELVNRGGMAAEGECSVAPPWRLESQASYRVEPGGRLFVKVAFMPEKAGDFLGEIRLSSQPDRSVVLRGIAQDALAVAPAQLSLALEPTTLVRAGVFQVTNHTPTEQIVRIRTDARLHCEPELRLKPGETAPVMIRTASEDGTALNEHVVLEAGPHRAEVAVSSAALPAVIRAVERTIDFGSVAAGTFATGQITLHNAGGASGWAVVAATPPFRAPPQRIDLIPGAKVAVPITVDAIDVGTLDQTLQIRTATTSFTVQVRATVVAPGSAPPRMSRSSSELPSLTPPAPEATPMPASVYDLDGSKPDSKLIVRPILTEPTRCILEWHADLSAAPSFIAERRELSIRAGQLTAKWDAFPHFRIERSGQHIRGVFEGLIPSHRYTVRVVELDSDKKRGSQIFQTSFDTPLSQSHRTRTGLLTTLIVAAAGLAGFAWWRRSQPAERPGRTLKKTQRIA